MVKETGTCTGGVRIIKQRIWMGWSAVECPSVVTTAFYSQTQWCLCTTEPSWPSRKTRSLLNSTTSSATQTSAHRPPFHFLGFTVAKAYSSLAWFMSVLHPAAEPRINQCKTNTNSNTQSWVTYCKCVTLSHWVAAQKKHKTTGRRKRG